MEAIEKEIIEIHGFFVAWFLAQCEKSEQLFHENLTSHFDENFIIIPPGGNRINGKDLFPSLWQGYGYNHEFNIQIRKVQTTQVPGFPEVIIATYEEWQRGARANDSESTNGRVSSAVFYKDSQQPNGVKWLHLQETWLPKTIVDADPFDF